jgi:hypothetical protein
MTRTPPTFTNLVLVIALAGVAVACASDDDGSTATDAQIESFQSQIASLQAETDSLEAELTATQADLETAERDLAAASDEAAGLQTALVEQTQRADAAETTLGAFPVTVPVSPATSDVAGNYVVSFSESYCSGFDACGTPPGIRAASITTVPGGLQIEFPDALTAALFDVEGSLFGIADSTSIVPPCDGVPRRSRVTVTVFGSEVVVNAEGGSAVTNLSASLVVDVPDLPGCPGGLVFYGTDLDRAT